MSATLVRVNTVYLVEAVYVGGEVKIDGLYESEDLVKREYVGVTWRGLTDGQIGTPNGLYARKASRVRCYKLRVLGVYGAIAP